MGKTALSARGAKPAASQRRRPAIVLVIVLVAVVVLSLAAYTFSDLMLAHHEAVQLSGRQIQALALVDSGVDVIRNYLLNEEALRIELGGHLDNPALFQAVPIKEDIEPSEQGNVSILSPLIDLDGNLAGVRFGLEDESARVNLNALLLADQVQENGGRTLLMNLPGMTEDVADSIMDWMDEDDEPREFGAEVDYYSSLSPPYAPKNGPFESIEELLLVRGVWPELLFGLDTNRNGVLDPHEQSGSSLAGGGAGGTAGATTGGAQPNLAASGTLGSLDRGWVGYVTLYSQEANLNRDGLPRINVNGDDLQALYDELSEVFSDDVAVFIVAYRLFGPFTEEGGDTGSISINQLDLTQEPQFPINQVLDLVGTRVRAEVDGQQIVLGEVFPSGIGEMNGYLPVLMDNATVNPSPVIPGRINIHEAPRAILAGIPGMTEEILEALLERRAEESVIDDPNRNHETWLLTQGLVTLEEMRSLMPFVNAGGDVYRAQVVGYFEDGAASARAEVVIDATAALPRVVFWRDMSHLGRGYPLEVLGVRLVDGL
ncbi:MAG: general secretion pathway protein GspK [Pirellulaceae bacterium]|nr:general secretion pathway protein GspK [Pirellulaceae bacterium]